VVEDEEMEAPDQSMWQTKQEVAAALHITERTLELKIKRGEIRTSLRERPGKKPWVILHPADIHALQHKPIAPMPTPKGEIAKRTQSELVSLPKAKPKGEISLTIRNFRDTLNSGMIPLPFHEIGWLSLADAARYSGLPKDIIKDAVTKGELSAMTRGIRYWIKWSDLRAFHPSGEIPKKPKAKDKAKEIESVRNGALSRSQIATAASGNIGQA